MNSTAEPIIQEQSVADSKPSNWKDDAENHLLAALRALAKGAVLCVEADNFMFGPKYIATAIDRVTDARDAINSVPG